MGPSGSGKTTLLDCLSGLVRPTQGSVDVLGQDLGALKLKEVAKLRREKMGLIYQGPELLPELTTAENVALTLLFDKIGPDQARADAIAALDAVGLADRSESPPEQLSGGEAQRVAVARALVRDTAEVIIADEPTASLDATNARTITELLITKCKESERALLIATHDPAVAQACDRTVLLGPAR